MENISKSVYELLTIRDLFQDAIRGILWSLCKFFYDMCNGIFGAIDDFFDRKSYGKEQSCTVSGNGNKVQNGKHNVMMEDQAKEIEYLLKLLKEKEALLEAKEMQLRDKDKIIKLLEDRK